MNTLQREGAVMVSVFVIIMSQVDVVYNGCVGIFINIESVCAF